MGIHSISIAFTGATAGYATYSPGDTIQGVMTLIIGGSQPHKLSSVLVKVRGLAKTLWKTRSGSNKNRKTHTHTEDLWLIREDIFFIRGPTVEALAPGSYQYAFSYTLRRGLPPTYSCQYGTISYLCKARAISHEVFAFNGKSEYSFTVLPQLDLNSEPSPLAEPLVIEREAETSWFGHAIGLYKLTMSHQACVGGQRIRITIDGPDRLFEKLRPAYGTVKLKRCTVCIAHNGRREEKRDVVEVQPGQFTSGWREIELVVPQHEGITISSAMCRIITVSYYIKIRSRHINVSLPLVVGTVPLTNSSWRRSPRPSAAELQPPAAAAEPWRCSPGRDLHPGSGGSPAGSWGRSPRHSPAAQHHSASSPALAAAAAAAAAAAPGYDPPPSYEQVMRDHPHTMPGADGGFQGMSSEQNTSGEFLSAAQRRRKEKESEVTGYTHLGDL